ncbi:WxcM-like domain-containing protein [Sphingomonas ginkgonis]|uniref:WxcM-like domain-containing protein n=1 Tax=Sphingomonas ginkgonis TaxID=2315330 RepID=A0A3R9X8M4_9SPHN|nr:FdtA/QdtA family cupin domain-containing protein [Sphingomonas ginkgonis]RST31376.1 WxcM-like domain-containing protein [Sphingomonas ginkgonis]
MSQPSLSDCTLQRLPVYGDERGQLAVIEGEALIGFPVRRVYYLFGTVGAVSRGFHAHHRLQQLAIAVRGSCRMLLDDGRERTSIWLDDPGSALRLPPMIWHEMHDFSDDCVLLVLADYEYDERDYIRDYAEFRRLAAGESV